MKLVITFIFLCVFCSCRHLRKGEGGSVDASIYTEYNGVTEDLIPFMYNIPSLENTEIYHNATMAVKIESVYIDGKLLKPIFGNVCFDEIDLTSYMPLNSTYVYFLSSEYLVTMVHFSSDGFRAVRYSLPETYKKAVIVYEIRDAEGLTGIKNTISLYQEGRIPKKKGPIDFSDVPDW